MTKATHPPIPCPELPGFPSYDQALVFAERFRTSGEGAHRKGKRWATAQWTDHLNVLAIQLQTNIYAIVAYPPAGQVITEAKVAEVPVYYRGWLLQYGIRSQKWSLLAGSLEVGKGEFNRLWSEHQGA